MTELHLIDIENEESLAKYLRDKKLLNPKDSLVVQLLSGGVSNRTVLVKINQTYFVMKQGLSKLRVPSDWFSNPARIQREALGMVALRSILREDQIPKLIFSDDTNNILMMEAIPQPHENFKTVLLKGKDESKHIQDMALMLASIHKKTWKNNKYANEFLNTEFFYELRIDPYFRYCVEKYPEYSKWFQKNIFSNLEIKNCLVHGDYSPKNMLVYKNELVLLDHEVIHYGDFAFDFGFVLTHLFIKSVHLASESFLKNTIEFSNTYFKEMKNLVSIEDQERSLHYFLACLFARVAGKSKTDYLGKEKEAKIKIVLNEMFTNEDSKLNLEILKTLFKKVQTC
jgi:5-methylthioribose kinase